MSTEFKYSGTELDLFAQAKNWKAYWAGTISRYVGRRVLAVGAGTGSTIKLLCTQRQERWLSLEPDAELADRMQRRRAEGDFPRTVAIKVGRVADLTPADQFDTVLYIDVLEHIEDDRLELERAAMHVSSGGYIVVLAPAHQSLFTPFDAAVGHFRRYSRKCLLDLTPSGLTPVLARYLDSVGLLASLGNRLFLKSSMPTHGQIKLWDSALVRASRVLDPLTFRRVGKSILIVWRKGGSTAPPRSPAT